MELTKIKRRDLKRGDVFCDANGMSDRLVMMLFIDKHPHHYDSNTEVYRIDMAKQKEIDGLISGNDTTEITTRLEECRRAKQVLQKYIDTINIKIAERDNEYYANAAALELLDIILNIVNPIIQSGEFGHPAQSYPARSNGPLSDEMSKLCRRVIMFRQQHNIVE